MFSEKTKKEFKLWTAILLIIYFVSFGMLVVHKFQLWILSPFVESHIAVFMSAGAIAIITGIILIFQSSVDSEQKKKQEVFKKKMDLYSSVIERMNDIRKDGKVTQDNENEILSILSKIALLSNLETFKEFNKFAFNLADDEGKIKRGYPSKLMDFVIAARNDLEVHGTISEKEKKELKEIKTKSESVITKYTRFNNIHSMVENYLEKGKLNPKTAEILLYVYNHLNKNKSGNINFKDNFTNSYLGIRKDDRIYLRIKTTQSAVTIEHLKEGECKNFLESQNIEVKPMSDKKDLYYVKFKELDDFKKCEDKFVEYLNFGRVVI